jgi:hypothetical protein
MPPIVKPERSAAEIVRQAGTASVQQAAARATVSQVEAKQPIRIIEEAEQVSSAQQPVEAKQAEAPAPRAQQVGPLFVTPLAEQPLQRTLFSSNAAPQLEPQSDEEAEEAIAGRTIFGRLANVGKAIAGSGKPELKPVREATVTPRKAEVKDATPEAQEEDELYDIPAFLRRQAN